MSLYIVFDNLWSLLETSQSANLAEDIEAAVTESVAIAGGDVSEVGQVTVSVEDDGKILLKVDDSSDGAASAIDYDKGAAALLSQIPVASALRAEQTQLPKIETGVSSRNEDNGKFYPVLEKLEISLRYRIDHADILRSWQEIDNSGSVGKLSKEDIDKERAEQDRRTERRFQEKQADNLRECLKHKRFTNQLQE